MYFLQSYDSTDMITFDFLLCFWEPPGGRTGPGTGTGHGTGGQGVEEKGARQAQSDVRSGEQSLTAPKTQA